jgi:hypothetical protein
VTTDGRRRPPRPRIELVSPVASESEAAAIVAAVEQFLADTAPAPAAAEPTITGWQRAALEEGVRAPEPGGGWKRTPGWRGRG